MSEEIQDLDLEENDGAEVVGGMQTGPVEPIVPKVEGDVAGVAGTVGRAIRPVNGSPTAV